MKENPQASPVFWLLILAVPAALLAFIISEGDVANQVGMALGGLALMGGLFTIFARQRQMRKQAAEEGAHKRIQKGGSYLATLLFILLISGPPMFRARDPYASIRGEVDEVVILHLVVWALAGVWVGIQVFNAVQRRTGPLKLWMPQKIAMALGVMLGLSALESPAPLLTAFKVYQLVIMCLFTTFYVQRYGVKQSLSVLFTGCLLMGVGIAIAGYIAPSTVFVHYLPGQERMRGDLIAPTAVVAVFGIVLLLSGVSILGNVLFLPLILFFGIELALALTRSGYVALLAFVEMALIGRVRSRAIRLFAIVLTIGIPIALLTGYSETMFKWVVRDTKSLSTLSDRLGLWQYLLTVTYDKSPWVGLGYYAASRIYGLQYNKDLGTAHSIFVEVLLGGGLISFAFIMLLFATLALYVFWLLRRGRDTTSFCVAALFVGYAIFGSVGVTLETGIAGAALWSVAAMAPALMEAKRRQAFLARYAQPYSP